MSNSRNLLNETQIRQFMKLASLEPLSPGFIHGLTERGSKAGDEGSEAAAVVEGDESDTHEGEDLEESHGRGRGEGAAGYGHPDDNGRAGARLREEAPGPEELEDFAADDLADDSLEGDEEAASDELEADVDLGVDAADARTVSVDDFLAALETALETVMDDEVEVTEEPAEEDELEADVELAPGDEDVDMEVELEEGVFGGGDKFEKIAKGKKGSYAPDPEAGEKDYTPTPEEMAKARKEKRTSSRDKVYGSQMGGTAGSWKPVVQENTDELVEQITKRVAARILKSALAKKLK